MEKRQRTIFERLNGVTIRSNLLKANWQKSGLSDSKCREQRRRRRALLERLNGIAVRCEFSAGKVGREIGSACVREKQAAKLICKENTSRNQRLQIVAIYAQGTASKCGSPARDDFLKSRRKDRRDNGALLPIKGGRSGGNSTRWKQDCRQKHRL